MILYVSIRITRLVLKQCVQKLVCIGVLRLRVSVKNSFGYVQSKCVWNKGTNSWYKISRNSVGFGELSTIKEKTCLFY